MPKSDGIAPAPAPIRDAATVILLRTDGPEPSVLMGMRGAGAVFMPNKYVFPGGAVDPGDTGIGLAGDLSATCRHRLGLDAAHGMGSALATAAIRELWEETGQILGRAEGWGEAVPEGWREFADAGFRPDAAALRFVFRAITPPGRPRRFDARFFLADAAALATDPDDFSRASDELSHLHWVNLREARELNLPFITEVVLGEIAARLAGPSVDPAGVPFFDNSGPEPIFRRLS
ncbi:MAG: NUDIX hydrolase [Rhodobacteraceae bacterium]|nr:NUDIX hydrolase [Paracoccaceae bacterium]